jgi:Leucine-rich repeat (LRR) protein
MRPKEDIKNIIKKMEDKTSNEMDKRVIDDVLQTLEKSQKTHAPKRRLIMKNPIIKFAAATVICLCVSLLIISSLQKSPNEQIPIDKIGANPTKTSTMQVGAYLGRHLVSNEPKSGEIRVKNLNGYTMNRQIPDDGMIGIGKGISWQYSEGKYITFSQQDVRVYVSIDESAQQLACLLLSDPNEIEMLRDAIEQLKEPTILWCKCDLPEEFIELPNADKIVAFQRASEDGSSIRHVKISNLSLLANFTELTSLDLSDCNGVTDLSPLANLTKLTELNLAGCDNISDISPLAKLVNLTSLDLRADDLNSPLADISPLSSCKKLKYLNLRLRQKVTDLSPLAELSELDTLNLRGISKDITDFLPLTKLRNLKTLQMSSLQNVKDLSQLGQITSLVFLQIGGVRNVTNTSSLANLINLKHLDLSQWMEVTDISSLAYLTNLEILKLTYFRKLSDISPLSQLTNLRSFQLQSSNVSDLSPLADLKNLRELDILGNKNISDIIPLANLTRLKKIELRYCPLISDITPIAGQIPLGAKISVDGPLKGQLQILETQAMNQWTADSSAIVHAKVLETTDTQVGEELTKSKWKVKVIRTIYGEVLDEIIDIVIDQPDSKLSEESFGKEMTIFLGKKENDKYRVILAKAYFYAETVEIQQEIEKMRENKIDSIE